MSTVQSQLKVPFKVKAFAKYVARNNREVSLEIGKVYEVTQMDNKGLWWQSRGENNLLGWFPSNYTTVIEEQNVQIKEESEKVKNEEKREEKIIVESEKVKNEEVKQGTSLSLKVKPLPKQQSMTLINEEIPTTDKVKVDKGFSNAPFQFVIHIVEARNLKKVGDSESKTNPRAFIFRRELFDDGVGKSIFHTKQIKKTVSPLFNEKFQIGVIDPESETMVVRLCSSEKYTLKGKNYLGEISFPLRSSARKYDHPDYLFQWFPVINGIGEVKIFVQFIDKGVSSFGKPTEVKQLSHIGFDEKNGFNLDNIPEQWKSIINGVVGPKKDILKNPNIANRVFNILKEAEIEAEKNGEVISLNQQLPSTITMNIPPPPPPPTSTPKTDIQEEFSNIKEDFSITQQLKEVKLKKVNETPKSEEPEKNTLEKILMDALDEFRWQIEGNDLDKEEEWSE